MRSIDISWKSLCSNKLTFFLNVLLTAFGTGILTIVLLGSRQVAEKLKGNAKGIDLVVGAKGSPLQLILSSIYFIDFPTGNISLKDADALARNPMVKRAVPLALGDNYYGFRIVGTDTGFVQLYDLKLEKGQFWKNDFEVVVGAEVARSRGLEPGDKLYGSHGLTSDEDIHEDHAYLLKGILQAQGNSTDNLVLTNISSIWQMHGLGEPAPENGRRDGDENAEMQDHREITSLLIQYRSRMSVVVFPMMVNKSTSMQAASPAKESARLFSLIGVGVNTVQWFAIILMFIAGISVFVSLYNSLKERSYDLAILRVLGASQSRLFVIMILEGLMLTAIGALSGLFLGHFTLQIIGYFQDSSQARLTGWLLIPEEIFVLAGGLSIGFIAAFVPAVEAYRSDISKTISKR